MMFDQATVALYHRALGQGRRRQLWSTLTGRSRCLLALNCIDATRVGQGRCDVRMQTVPIAQICGSESRAGDFDCDFYPLQNYTQDRWLSIARARQRGRELPPVALIQVGNLYFVRDGHHRISVARALGQSTVEASVEVWQLDGPLPWDAPPRMPMNRSTGQSIGLERVFGKLKREGARLQERFLSNIRDLFGANGLAPKSPALPRPGVDGS